MSGPDPSGRAKLIALRAALLAVSLVVALGAAEGLLRATGYEYRPLHITPISPDDTRYFHTFQDEHFVFDPYLVWKPRPGVTVFNNLGYRGAEVSPAKRPGEYRILAIGDSNTLGWDKGGPNWPEYLEAEARPERDVVVMNAGVWGYTTFQGVRRFERSLGLQPDMVLVCFGSNDALEGEITDAQFAARLSYAAMAGGSRLAQLVFAGWDRLAFRASTGPVRRVPRPEFTENLRQIIDLGRRHGVTVVLLTRPFTGTAGASSWKIEARRYGADLLQLADAEGVASFDLHERFRGMDQYFADESHFNEEGHRLAARMIYERIEGLIGH